MDEKRKHLRWEELTESERDYFLRSYPVMGILKDESVKIRAAYLCFKALEADYKMLKQKEIRVSDHPAEIEAAQHARKRTQDELERNLDWLRENLKGG